MNVILSKRGNLFELASTSISITITCKGEVETDHVLVGTRLIGVFKKFVLQKERCKSGDLVWQVRGAGLLPVCTNAMMMSVFACVATSGRTRKQMNFLKFIQTYWKFLGHCLVQPTSKTCHGNNIFNYCMNPKYTLVDGPWTDKVCVCKNRCMCITRPGVHSICFLFQYFVLTIRVPEYKPKQYSEKTRLCNLTPAR